MRILLFLIILPFTAFAQETVTDLPLHLREIPRHNVSIDLGIAEPIGDYGDIARSGLSVGLTYDYYFNKNLGISAGLRHTYNETAFDDAGNANPQNERSNSITAGIVGSKTINRFQIDGFLRAGIGFLDTNDGTFVSRNNDEAYSTFNREVKNSSIVLDVGARFNYYFRRSVQVYFSPQLQTTLSQPQDYTILRPSNDFVNNNETTAINFSNLIFSLGVKFAIGKQYTNGELRDDSEPDN